MLIGICSILAAIFLALGKMINTFSSWQYILRLGIVIRITLVRENRRMDQDDRLALSEAKRERIELAAKLEGITIEEALEKQRGFRYLF